MRRLLWWVYQFHECLIPKYQSQCAILWTHRRVNKIGSILLYVEVFHEENETMENMPLSFLILYNWNSRLMYLFVCFLAYVYSCKHANVHECSEMRTCLFCIFMDALSVFDKRFNWFIYFYPLGLLLCYQGKIRLSYWSNLDGFGSKPYTTRPLHKTTKKRWNCMMTSSNGNIFRSTGPILCGEFTRHTGEFPLHRPVTQSFDVFFDLRLMKRLSKR